MVTRLSKWHRLFSALCWWLTHFLSSWSSLGSWRHPFSNQRHSDVQYGHWCVRKTYVLVARKFYVKRIKLLIAEFVQTWTLCQRIKPGRHATQGVLKPLPLPRSSGNLSHLIGFRDSMKPGAKALLTTIFSPSLFVLLKWFIFCRLKRTESQFTLLNYYFFWTYSSTMDSVGASFLSEIQNLPHNGIGILQRTTAWSSLHYRLSPPIEWCGHTHKPDYWGSSQRRSFEGRN